MPDKYRVIDQSQLTFVAFNKYWNGAALLSSPQERAPVQGDPGGAESTEDKKK
jgi:hypothetical protein